MKIKNLKGHQRHALLAANFFSVFGWALLSPLYALYVIELGGDAQSAALAWSLYTLLGGIIIIVLGRLEDRMVNKWRVITTGYVLQTLGVALLFLANDLRLMIAGYAVYAVGTGFVAPVWKQVFGRLEIHGKAATEWGIFHGGNMLLISAAAAISSYLFNFYGFKGLLAIMLAAHIVSIVLAFRLLRQAQL
jgi:MFS family permease